MTAVKLTIPEGAKVLLALLLSQPAEAFDHIAEDFSKLTDAPAVFDITQIFMKHLQVNVDQALLVENLYEQLLRVYLGDFTSLDDFTSELKDALERSNEPNLQPKEYIWASFENSFKVILGSNALKYSLKKSVGLGLILDNERLFNSAKFITSIVPFDFGEVKETLTHCGAIIHIATIEFQENGAEKKYFHLSFTEAGLSALKESISNTEAYRERLKKDFIGNDYELISLT